MADRLLAYLQVGQALVAQPATLAVADVDIMVILGPVTADEHLHLSIASEAT